MMDSIFMYILFLNFIVQKLLSTLCMGHRLVNALCNCLERLSQDELYVQRLFQTSTTHGFYTDHDHTENTTVKPCFYCYFYFYK